MGPGYPGATRADGTAPSGYVQLLEARLGAYGSLPCPVPLTVRGTQTLVSFAPLAFKLF